MSHQHESGAYFYGMPAWHRLGKVFDDTMAPRQAFAEANADFTVVKQPIFHNETEVPFAAKVVRTDIDRCISVQSATYNLLQNEELIKVAEAVHGRGNAFMDSVCVLDDGRKVVFTMRICQIHGEVVKDDEIRIYLVGVTSHDGSLKFHILFTPVRVVCNNTLQMALQSVGGKNGNSKRIIGIKHTRNAQQLIERLPEIIDTQQLCFTHSLEAFKLMASKTCSSRQFHKYVADVFADKLSGKVCGKRGDKSTEREKTLGDLPAWEHIEGHFDCGLGTDLRGVKGTMWGAYNAVTQYLTHDAGRLLDPSEGARARLESLYWGENAKRNEKALELALAACN